MSKQLQQRKSGGMRKYGRDTEKCKRYTAMHTREMNKVRRVLRSNGIEAAKKWADEHNVRGYLAGLLS